MSGVSERSELLDLTPGTVLQMQPVVPEHAPRYMVRLIGSLPAASLVVTTPTVDGRVQLIREGQRFNVRVLKGERVVGFVARVLHVALRPYAHLHLEYPSEFEQIVVRNASRVSARLPGTTRRTEDPNEEDYFKPVTLVDLSETGAGLLSREAIGGSGEMVHLRFALSVSGSDEALSLMGEIRTSVRHEDDAGYSTGVAFRGLNRFQQILLNAWVTRRLLDDAMRVN